jgi:hypothetical protein
MKRLLAALLVFAPAVFGAGDTHAALETRADRLRTEAWEKFEHADYAGALKLNRRALKVTRHLPETDWRTIQNYDNAGLYYYETHQWKKSAQHQAIAVLLACAERESAEMFPTYVERLGWAFAKYRPGEDFRAIAGNPLVLLSDVRLDVRASYDLRRRYFKTIKAKGTQPGEPPRYIYKLRPETLPQTCYVATGHSAAAAQATQIQFLALMAPEFVSAFYN